MERSENETTKNAYSFDSRIVVSNANSIRVRSASGWLVGFFGVVLPVVIAVAMMLLNEFGILATKHAFSALLGVPIANSFVFLICTRRVALSMTFLLISLISTFGATLCFVLFHATLFGFEGIF
jgi:hypothetical protein